MKAVAILLMLFLASSKLCAQTVQSMEIFPDFDKGHFYTKDGKKVEGLLHLITNDPFTDNSYGACSVLYKESKRAQKHKFTTNDICCFVIGKDSFAIITNVRINRVYDYPQDFAKVKYTGAINLYVYQGAGLDEGWFIEKDGMIEHLTRNKFDEQMKTYLSDYPELLKRIKKKEFQYEASPKIIKIYNEHFKEDQNKP